MFLQAWAIQWLPKGPQPLFFFLPKKGKQEPTDISEHMVTHTTNY